MFNAVVTNKGRILQNKQVDGATIEFTRVVSSASVVPVVNLKEQTSIASIKQTLTVQFIKQNPGEQAYTIQVLLDNTKLTTAYNLSQIGFYAKDPDDGEILFAIAQLDTVKKIDSYNDMPGYTLEMNFKFKNSNDANVTMEFDANGLMTREGVEVLVGGEEIAGTASGNVITVTDSTDAPLNDIKVYGASKQEVTNGYQLYDYTKLPTKSQGGATVTNNGDGSFTVSGSGTLSEQHSNAYYYTHEEIIQLLKAGMVYMKCDKETLPRPFMQLVHNGSVLYTITDGTSFNLTQEIIDSPTFSANLYFNGGVGNTIIAGTVKPMLYQDGDGTFEVFTGGKPGPNQDYPLPIESVGDGGSVQIDSCCKNLVKNTATTQTKNGITFTVNEDGTVNVNGTATSDVSLFVFTNLQNVLKVGEKYILNGSPNGCSIDTCYMEINHIWYGDIGDGSAFTYKEGITGCYIVVRSGITVSNKVFKPMIRLATVKDGSYEQHKKSTAKVPLTEPLYGIPVSSGGNYTDENGQLLICNEIDLARNVLVKNLARDIFNGSDDELWYFNALQVSGKYSYYIKIDNAAVIARALSNAFIFKSWYSNPWEINQDIVSITGDNWLYLYTDFKTVDELKAYLSANPVTVIYELAEPVETPLTEEQVVALDSIRTYEPTTNIFADGMASMKVNYFKNTNNGKASAIMASKIVNLHSILGEMSSLLDEIIGGA